MGMYPRLIAATLGAVLLAACGDRDDVPAPAATEPTPVAGAAPPAPPAEAAAHRIPPPYVPVPVQSADPTPTGTREGAELYAQYCQACHDPGPGHPGTMMLASKKGEDQAVIRGRADLTADYVTAIVRGGLIEMAPFRPTDITDAELSRLVGYLLAPPPG